MERRRWFRGVIVSGAAFLAALACAGSAPSLDVTPSVARTSSPAAASQAPQSEGLWYLTLGEAKADQGWGVAVDESGDVYFATHQQSPGELFYDMVIYRITPDGSQVWHTRWGGKVMEKALVVAVDSGVVYAGGLTYTSANLTQADMAVLALDAAGVKCHHLHHAVHIRGQSWVTGAIPADQVLQELLLGTRRLREVPGEGTARQLRLILDHGQALPTLAELQIEDVVEPPEVGVGTDAVLHQVAVDHPTDDQVGVQAAASRESSRMGQEGYIAGT